MAGVLIDVAISRSQRSCKIKNTFGTTGSTMVDLLGDMGPTMVDLPGDSESNFQGFLWTKFSSLLFIFLFFELFSCRRCCCYFLDLFFFIENWLKRFIFFTENYATVSFSSFFCFLFLPRVVVPKHEKMKAKFY